MLLAAPVQATEWSPQSNIDPVTESDAFYPIPVITPDGTAWAFWYRDDPVELDREVYYSRWNGQSWDVPQTVNPSNSTDDRVPRVACAADGGIWVLWDTPRMDGSDAYVGLTSRWSGTAWTWPDTVWVDGTRYNNYDVYAVSATESWFIREGSGGDAIVYHHSGAVRDSVRFDLPSAAAYQPTIAVDGDGVVWAAWTHQEFPTPERLEFSRRVSGTWTQPEILPLPVEIKLPRLSVDRDNAKWIVCGGDDPGSAYKGDEIWAVRWNGNAWDPPTRISEPIQSNDSIQVYNAVSRTPGEYPRVVWMRANIWNYSRRDVVTTAWDGSAWSPVEVVGNLSDSTYVNWPDVAVRGPVAWVAWMAEPKNPPFVFNIVASHSIPPTTTTFSTTFETASTPVGIRLSWSVQPLREAIRLRVYRSQGTQLDLAPAPDASVILESPLEHPGTSTTIDRSLTERGPYTYWLHLSFQGGRTLWVGPRTALYSPRSGRSRLVTARPNPSGGGIALRGVRGANQPTHVNIYTAAGRMVRSLRVTGTSAAEDFSLLWDGRGSGGGTQSNGIYFARLVTEGQPAEGPGLKLVLLR